MSGQKKKKHFAGWLLRFRCRSLEIVKLPATQLARGRKEELGQFLTASPVADFMASMFGPLPKTVRLLDAGAGAGALTLAFVSRCCEKREGVCAIEANLYELDGEIMDALSATMRECERRCSEEGIRFTFTIHSTDFIQEMSVSLAGDLFGTTPLKFDAAIANPPYRKINADSTERRALRAVGVETSNLCARRRRFIPCKSSRRLGRD